MIKPDQIVELFNSKLAGVSQIKIMPQERDDKLMERFSNDIPIFIEDMDKAMNRLGIEWESQWS